jgi:hypothetical protein
VEGLNVPAGARFAETQRRLQARIDVARLALPALLVLMVVAAALLLHETRGTTFWFDEWEWALGRRGNSLSTFLDPHNGHLSLVPILLYRLLFATAGLRTYVPYRLVVTAGHLVCVGLVFIYCRRRTGDLLALLGATLILFLGPAWEDILWPFQIAWLASIGCGVGALLMLDRRDRTGDIAACVLLTISVCCSSVGVAVLVGAIVEVLWQRRRFQDTWIVGVPFVLYLLWSIGYQNTSIEASNVFAVPGFAAQAAAGVLAALVGLGGNTFAPDGGTLLTFGVPLLVAGVVILCWRVIALGRIPVRVVTLLAMVLAFWALVALGRAQLEVGYDSRYLYIGAVPVVLIAAELARGVRPRGWAAAVLAAVAALAAISNIGTFRAAGALLRVEGGRTAADLGALDLVQGIVPADYVATSFTNYPYVTITAGPYFAAQRAIGSPAASAAQLAAEPEDARFVTDGELVHAHGVGLVPATASLSTAGPPRVDQSSGGSISSGDSCLTFASGFNAAGTQSQIQLAVPPGGVLVTAVNAPASVGVRRYAQAFHGVGTLAAGATGALRISPDRSALPWHLQLVTQGRVIACQLSG